MVFGEDFLGDRHIRLSNVFWIYRLRKNQLTLYDSLEFMSMQASTRPKHSLRRRVNRWSRQKNGLLGWVALAMAVVGIIVLGTIDSPNESYSRLTTIFMAFQMLTLNEGGAAEPISWELNIARLLAIFLFRPQYSRLLRPTRINISWLAASPMTSYTPRSLNASRSSSSFRVSTKTRLLPSTRNS